MNQPGRKPPDMGMLIGDLLRFQVKLGVDALRDVVLIPLTLVAAALDVLLLRFQTPRLFYMMLRLGERSERLIDLWSALYQRYAPGAEHIDAALARVECAVRDPRQSLRRARIYRRWAGMRIAKAQRGSQVAPPTPQPKDPTPC